MSDAPKSFTIEKLAITNSLGQVVDVTTMFARFEIYEDVFSNVVTAQLDLIDSLDLPTIYEWHGNETVQVEMTKPPFDFRMTLNLRIYKMGNTEFNETKKRYTLYLCSEELSLSESQRVSKSYRSMLISDMVADIAKNYLGVPDDKLKIEPTTGVYTIIIPNLKPLEAINWLSAKAVGEDRVPLFFFFQKTDGVFYFKNIQSMAKEPAFRELWAQSQQQPREMSLIEKMLTNNKAEWVHTFNTLAGLNTGAYGGRLHLLDLIGRDYKTIDYSILTDNKVTKRINDWYGFNNAKDKLGNALYDSTGFTTFSLAKDFNDDESDAQDRSIQRASHLGIVSQNRVRVLFPGDPRVSVGQVMVFKVPVVTPGNRMDAIKQSGNYLISAVNHSIFPDRYQTACELISDSTGQGFTTVSE